jgi:DMSO reductase family type II enzyme chaperone
MMPIIEIDPSRNPAALHAANRSLLYVLLADGFRFPSLEFHDIVQSGAYRDHLHVLAERLPYPLAIAADGLGTSSGYLDLQAEYIRLFDVGPKGRPPCTLYEGEYRGGARMQVMEELVRFYEHFGLSLSSERRELPDHLTVELEFLHYLTFKEAAALERGQDAGAYRRAEIDFLARHPARCLSVVRAKVAEQHAEPPFAALTSAAEAFVHADLDYLRGWPGA